MTIADRIRYVRDRMGLSQAQFAEALQVNPSYISRLESGSSTPSNRLINAMSLISHVSDTWIRQGEGPIDSLDDAIYTKLGHGNPESQHFTKLRTYRGQRDIFGDLFEATYPRISSLIDLLDRPESQEFLARLNLLIKYWDTCDPYGRARVEVRMEDLIPDFAAKLQEYQEFVAAQAEGRQERRKKTDTPIPLAIPVVGKAAAGLPIEMVEIPDETSGVSDDAVRNGDMIVIADGDSMIEAGIHNGDHCVIRPMPQVEQGQIALVAVGDGSTIKRFYVDPEGYRLVSCNPAYPDQHYPPDAPIRILGRFIKTVAAES